MINPSYADKMLVVPWDSGAFCRKWGGAGTTPIGTLDEFYHLVEPHIATIGDSLKYMMERWWVPGTAAGSDSYFECEILGNVWLPEDLLAITVST